MISPQDKILYAFMDKMHPKLVYTNGKRQIKMHQRTEDGAKNQAIIEAIETLSEVLDEF